MGRIIPNTETFIGFTPTLATGATTLIPTAAEVNSAVNLTPFAISLNAMSQGNNVPTPSFDTLFETSVPGTVSATFTADFYRDDTAGGDTAWDTLPRTTSGFFLIARYNGKPIAASKVEVWPVRVLSRSMANMANNTVETFTVTCAVPKEPNESATVT